MNVTEIVRELKMTKEEFFPLAQELGFDIGERAIKVDDQIAIKLIQAIKQHKKQGAKKSLFEHEKKTEDAPADKTETNKNKSTTTTDQTTGQATEESDAKIIAVTDPITTKAFAELLDKEVTELIAILVRNGIMATINQNLDFETVSIIAEDLGYTAELKATDDEEMKVETARQQKLETALQDTSKKMQDRPPVIVVMGHVDHGKTKLLDAIRETDIAGEEAGGITQTIGAYQITYNKRDITFIDTPGHEAFTAMRSRGANIADLAILVVAADDGVKPQTEEAIEILEKAGLPFVVAINKIDKPEADIDKVKKGLSELNLIPEDWGGKTICVPISAKAGTNLNELLEMVLLLADLNKDKLQANPDRDPVGTIIESLVDKDAGAVATVLIQTGTLRIGDAIEVGDVSGKIKALHSWKGDIVNSAGPSMPVRFLGLKGAPVVGDILTIIDKKISKKKKKSYQSFAYLQTKAEHEDTGKIKLPIILKADTLGSLEAIVESLNKIKHAEVSVDIIKRGLGNFTEKDIDQASASKALLIGFNVQMTPAAADYALGTQTTSESFSIIYKLIEYVEVELEKLLQPEVIYNKIGEVKILKIFRVSSKNTIAGGRVQSGMAKQKAITKLVRDGKTIGEATIRELKNGPTNVPEMKSGSECGMNLDATVELQEGDVIEIYETEEKKRNLHTKES